MSWVSTTLLSVDRSADATVIVTTYVGKYFVTMSSPTDTAALVGQSPGIPAFGSVLNTDPLANVVNIKPDRDNKSQLHWYVTVTWSRLPRDKEHENNNAQPDDNPANWRDKVDLSIAKFTGPIVAARCITPCKAIPNSGSPLTAPAPQKGIRIYVPGTGYIIKAVQNASAQQGNGPNGLGPIMVASGEIPDPPPERDFSRTIIRVTRFSLNFPYGLGAWVDAVNSDTFNIVHPGMNLTIPPFVAKFEPFSSQLNYHINRRGVEIPYYETRMEISLRADTWRLQVLNRGFGIRQLQGDQNDQGQIVGGFQYNTPDGVRTVPGSFAPRIARMHDARKIPTPPMLLDINGQRLPDGKPPIYLTYQVYPEVPFAPLQL